ncbi:GNAT family N-acetyltransferase [Paraburkholderia phytofirmans]|uniref:GNAT family N-acetyltransferase n=1 Tax=Paraburkholderia phytofirmans TaxID=261302 RepID=UPI0038BD7281
MGRIIQPTLPGRLFFAWRFSEEPNKQAVIRLKRTLIKSLSEYIFIPTLTTERDDNHGKFQDMYQPHCEIAQVNRAEDIESAVLRDRADRGWRVWTSGFVSVEDTHETGLLMLDFYDQTRTAKVYEVFVLDRFRRRGVGAKLMERAELAARGLDARMIELEVHPLDGSTDACALRSWYSALGFIGELDVRLMTKDLQSKHNA